MHSVLAFLLGNAALVAVLALVVLALVAVVRRPTFAHRAWLLVALKLVTPPLAVVPILWPLAGPRDVDGTPRTEVVTTAVAGTTALPPLRPEQTVREDDDISVEPAPASPTLPSIAFDPGPAPAAIGAADADPPVLLNAVKSVVTRTQPIAGEIADAPPLRNPGAERALPDVATVVFGAWAAGALIWWGLAAVRLLRFGRLLNAATAPASPEVRAVAGGLARRLGLRRLPRVDWLDADLPPMVWALFGRPRILLPRRLWGRLDDGQRAAVLAHELAHLRRGDHWVRRLELLVLGLYWWFPLAWWLRGRIEQSEEICCDAWVLWALPGTAVVYAEALVETVSYLSRPRLVPPPLASGAGRVEGLKRRLFMILQRPPAHRLSWRALAGLVALAGLALPWQLGLAEAPQDAPKVVTPPPPAPAAPAPVGGAAGGVPAAPAAPAPGAAAPVGLPGAPGGLVPAGSAPPGLPGTPAAPAPIPSRAPPPPSPAPPGIPPAALPVRSPAVPGTVAPTPPAAASEDVDRLKDEIELLEAQREVKEAQVAAAEAVFRGAEQQRVATERVVRQNVKSPEEFAQAVTQAETAKAQLAVRRGELKEHNVKIRQAKRRLAALMKGAARGAMTPPEGASPKPGAAPSPDTPAPNNRTPLDPPAPSVGGQNPRNSFSPPAPRQPAPAADATLAIAHDFGVVGRQKVTTAMAFAVPKLNTVPRVKNITSSDPVFGAEVVSDQEKGILRLACTADGTKFTGKKAGTIEVVLAEPPGERIRLNLRAESKPLADAERAQQLEAEIKLLKEELDRLKRESAVRRKGPDNSFEAPGEKPENPPAPHRR